MRPFEGIRVIDVTHVLAGPFAAYQLAVLGADVIKVDDPNDPDQSRSSGTDKELNDAQMGTGFLTQASNKRMLRLIYGLGFRKEGVIRQGYGREDMIVCGMVYKEAKRWLKRK